MRINKIEIKGLFGMFNHTIPLNYKERITIIYGINGIGKTMLFRILDSFFNLNFFKLVRYPFESLIIEFDNQEYFILNNSEKSFIIEYKHKQNEKVEEFDLSKYKEDFAIGNRYINLLEDALPILRISDDSYISRDTNEILTINEVLYKYSDKIPYAELRNEIKLPKFDDFKKIIKKTYLYYIQTQRLIVFNSFIKENYYQTENKESNIIITIENVKKFSNELSEIIQNKYKEYAELSQEFELSLGKRLISKDIILNLNDEELKKENKLLETRRNELKSVGLLEDTKDDYSNIPETDIERAILSVNIQDMKKKLEIFDNLYKKLKIFLDILNNRRFTFKTISINPKKGFVFKNDNGEILDSSELSSGEQHEIVLLYQLLFKIPENSLVLIDEPEISLHVAWQMEFLSDMEEIVKLRNIDLLVATHSPTIINGNWNLTVELGK